MVFLPNEEACLSPGVCTGIMFPPELAQGSSPTMPVGASVLMSCRLCPPPQYCGAAEAEAGVQEQSPAGVVRGRACSSGVRGLLRSASQHLLTPCPPASLLAKAKWASELLTKARVTMKRWKEAFQGSFPHSHSYYSKRASCLGNL